MFFFRSLTLMLTVCMFVSSVPAFSAGALSDEDISAPSAVLMEAGTGRVLYEKDPHGIRACASVTKVMTLILVMEAIDSGRLHWDDKVVTSAHAASMGGSDIWLEQGETMTVDEMVKAVTVASANDAAVALAETVCGTEEEFVRKMNEKAQSSGMKDTVFKNCNGLDEEGHVTSAYDVALMSRELIKHEEIFRYSGIWMDELRGGKTQLVNTNKLLKTYKGITGLKTGTTSKAGSCISATAERDGLSLIAVVLGSSTGKERFTDASKLLDYGFDSFEMYQPELPAEAEGQIAVSGGMTGSVRISASADKPVLIGKGRGEEAEAEVILPGNIEAPVKKGDAVGKVIYKSGGEQIAEYPIAAAEDAEQINYSGVVDVFIKGLAG